MTTLARDQWREVRRQYLGGSDAAPAIGRSKYRTPADVYFDKAEGVRTEETEPMRRGLELEPLVAHLYKQRYPHDLGPSVFIASQDHPWMAATPDITDKTDACLVQLKTSSTYNRDTFGDPERGDLTIPGDYMIQVQHEMAVCKAPENRLAVLFASEEVFRAMRILIKAGRPFDDVLKAADGAYEFQVFPIMRNDTMIQDIIESERRFWEDHVQAKVPPPDASHPQRTDDIREAADAEVALCEKARQAYRQLKLAEARWQEYKSALTQAIGDDTGIALPDGDKVTWKAPAEKRITEEVTDYQGIAYDLYITKQIPDDEWNAMVEKNTTKTEKTKQGPRVLRVPRIWGKE